MYITKLSKAVSVTYAAAPQHPDAEQANRHYIQRIGQDRQSGVSPNNPWGLQAKAPCRVLQVEDNDEYCFIVRSYLKKQDFIYESAEHGEHALALLTVQDFDIILMDIDLGTGINGIETTRHIRSHQKNAYTTILAVTAHVSPQIKDDCLQAGMNGFLPKPFLKDDLMQAMDRTLQARL
ncbi:MAG: response regulator [Balneolales bacterium]